VDSRELGVIAIRIGVSKICVLHDVEEMHRSTIAFGEIDSIADGEIGRRAEIRRNENAVDDRHDVCPRLGISIGHAIEDDEQER
jgi:hypothetical protein